MTSRAGPGVRNTEQGRGREKERRGIAGREAEVGSETHREEGGRDPVRRGCGAWPEAENRTPGVWARTGAGLTRLARKCRPGSLLPWRVAGEGRGLEARGKGGTNPPVPELQS